MIWEGSQGVANGREQMLYTGDAGDEIYMFEVVRTGVQLRMENLK